MNPTIQKYLPVIGIVVTGGILLIMIIYKISTSTELGGDKKSYQKSLSLDKLYDEAGGNDPLSDSIMTSQIDLSTENNSCSFMVTYKGIRDRSVKCMKGCNDDESDDNSNFCKQFEYPGGDDKLQDTFLDQTYTRRRGSRKINEAEKSTLPPCNLYPLVGEGTGGLVMDCENGGELSTKQCLGTADNGEDYSNNCYGYNSEEKSFYNCETDGDGEGGFKLITGEKCKYNPECKKMSNPEGWMLETKQYMNKILGKCPSEELQTESSEEDGDTSWWKDLIYNEDGHIVWWIYAIITAFFAIGLGAIILWGIKRGLEKTSPISTNTASTPSA